MCKLQHILTPLIVFNIPGNTICKFLHKLTKFEHYLLLGYPFGENYRFSFISLACKTFMTVRRHHTWPIGIVHCSRGIYVSNKSKCSHLHNRGCQNCLLVITVVNSLGFILGIIELNWSISSFITRMLSVVISLFLRSTVFLVRLTGTDFFC